VFKWNEEKNSILKSQRGFSFSDVVKQISEDGIIDNYKHPNVEKYPHQFIYVIALGGYIHYVPYVFDDDIFLKNIIPSRKLHKKYAKEI